MFRHINSQLFLTDIEELIKAEEVKIIRCDLLWPDSYAEDFVKHG